MLDWVDNYNSDKDKNENFSRFLDANPNGKGNYTAFCDDIDRRRLLGPKAAAKSNKVKKCTVAPQEFDGLVAKCRAAVPPFDEWLSNDVDCVRLRFALVNGDYAFGKGGVVVIECVWAFLLDCMLNVSASGCTLAETLRVVAHSQKR